MDYRLDGLFKKTSEVRCVAYSDEEDQEKEEDDAIQEAGSFTRPASR
jgi:hypothetical protein